MKRTQLYPLRANALTRWIIWITTIGSLIFMASLWAGWHSDWRLGQNQAPDQPVLFSHHHHAGELQIDCRVCHGGVETSSFAGMPPTQTCMSCHSQIFTDSPMLAPVIQSAESGQPIAWNRVYNLPDYVYFNHSAHLNHGVGCTSCHGEIGTMRGTTLAQPLTMAWCLECHRNPAPRLRHEDQLFAPTTPTEAISERNDAQSQALLAHYQIETRHLTDCTTCHR